MGRVLVEFLVVNNSDVQVMLRGALAPDKVRHAKLTGIVDTGSSHLILPGWAATQLGVPKAEDVTVHYADRSTATRDLVEQVNVELLGRRSTFRALVEPKRDTALIGAIVLEDLDLLVNCKTGILEPRNPEHLELEVE